MSVDLVRLPRISMNEDGSFVRRTCGAVQIRTNATDIESILGQIRGDGRKKRLDEMPLVEVIFVHGQYNAKGKSLDDDTKIFELMAALAKLPNLRGIHFSIDKCKKLMAEPITYFLNRAKSLQKLTMEDMTLKGNVQGLKQALMSHSSLQIVCLSRVWCWPPYALLDALSNMKQLKAVKLDRIVLSHQLKPQGVKALSSLWKSVKLERIVIENFTQRVSKQVTDMLECLESHPSVKALMITFDRNAILPEQVLNKVSRLLEVNTCLEKLILPWIGDCALPFIKALHNNHTLTEFRVIGKIYPPASDKLIQASCEMLEVNTTLRHFIHNEIYGGYYPEPQAIHMYLSLNKMNRQYLLENENATREEWYEAICHHRDDISITYYLLSRNPSIMCSPDVIQTIERQQDASGEVKKKKRVQIALELNGIKQI